jgi:CBS domain-containing protein
MMSHNDIFGATMAGLEAGFKVLHITTHELSTCTADSDVNEVLSNPSQKDFDHIPVKSGDRIVGVLERESQARDGTVRDYMRPLDDSMLVSAEEPLPKFLPTLVASSYRLVVRGVEVRGIVTLSDVAKLPVRLVAFTLVIHMEAMLADVIRREGGDDEEWLKRLRPEQRKMVEKRLKRRRKQNIHLLSPIEVTDLSHKITVVGKLRGQRDFENELRPIVKLRNSLAHAADFVEECGGVKGLLERLALVEHWIDALK